MKFRTNVKAGRFVIESQRNPESEVIAMHSRCHVRNWIGLACLLLIPEFAKAANPCPNIRPSFTYPPVVTTGGRSTLEVSAQAGCFWEMVSHPEWIKILSLNRGFGSGSVVFQVLPNKTSAPSSGFIRLEVRDLNKRHVTTLDLPIRATRNLSSSAALTVFPRW